MDNKSARASVAALVLVVAGGVSALSATFTSTTVGATTVEQAVAAPAAMVITEYVDQAGNPAASPLFPGWSRPHALSSTTNPTTATKQTAMTETHLPNPSGADKAPLRRNGEPFDKEFLNRRYGMDMKSAVSAAAALVLVVAGGATALSAAQSPVTSSPAVEPASQETAVATTVITEYVDEFGNPVAAPGSTVLEVRTFGGTEETTAAAPAEPEIIWIDAPTPVATQTAFVTPTTSGEYEYSGGDDDEYEEHDDEYEEHHDEYEHDEHEEHEDD